MSRYALITPLRDEAENLERIAACVSAQTVRPDPWVLVENGSTDDTPCIAACLASEHSWIRLLEMPSPVSAERGTPIVLAFHHALATLDRFPSPIGQLDADLTFAPDYFERLLRELETNDDLGIVSGTCFEHDAGEWRERFGTGASVWGAARLYRRACLDVVLPLEARTGWDAIDVAVANAQGWETKVVRDLAFYHHRREAERERSRWSAWYAQGRVSHYLGYRPSYLVIRAAFQTLRDPAALGLIAGFAGETLRRRPRCARSGVTAWVREQQRLRRLTHRVLEARGRRQERSAS